MATKHPNTTYAMAVHSSFVGFSKSMTLVTNKLMMIELEPKTPTVDGGNHVNAKKSNVDAAMDKKIAITNNGLKKTGVVKGWDLLLFLVRGSW
jgi:hypothetical protein